jgi:hypothetical protein
MSSPSRFDPVDILTLHGIRTFIRDSSARGGVVFFALLYGLASAFTSGMVLLASFQGGYSFTILWTGGPGTSFWNYPGLLVVAPWGVVSAPFFPTLSMIVVSVGVGYGMTVAFLLAVQLVRNRRAEGRGAPATGAIAGLTPAMITLVTLGACCSTTAAASAGVGLVAVAAGTTTNNLLLNNWFLGVFQIAVVWVALVAQEMLLVVYAGLFGAKQAGRTTARPPPLDRRSVASGALRVALLVGGLLWSLSMVAEWTTVSPWTAGAGLWVQWVVQHQLVAAIAVAAALFPQGTWRAIQGLPGRARRIFRAVLVLAGVSLLWVPPPLPGWGLDGFLNQFLYLVGAPAAWGTISPGAVAGTPLALRWALEYALLGLFAIGVAIAGERLFSVLGWSTGGSSPDDLSTRARTVTSGSGVDPRASDPSPVDPLGSATSSVRGP